MRPVLKYPATLFILLLIGYSQLFAPLFRVEPLSSTIKIAKASGHEKILVTKNAETEAIFIEEEEQKEEERIYFKKPVEAHASFSFAQLEGFLLPHIQSYSAFTRHFSYLSLSGAHYLALCVFRI